MSFEVKISKLEKVLSFANGRSSPDRDESAEIDVFGSNGLIGKANQSNSPVNTIIIGRVGSYCGSVHYSKNACWVTDNAIRASAKGDNDPVFLYHLLKFLNLNNWRSGSGQPLLNQATLNSIEAPIPEPSDQRGIASLIGSLDNRITLLRETNETLEAIAQTIFKSWFADFDPVRAKAEGKQPEGIDEATAALFPDGFEETEHGIVPRGWSAKGLDEIANYLNGLALQKYPPTGADDLPVIKIAQLRKGDTAGADMASRAIKPEYIVNDGDVLFSWSGTLEVEIWCGGEGALNQHLFKVTSSSYPKWFYYLWTKYHLQTFRQIAENKATTMGHIQRAHLNEAKVFVPTKAALEVADAVIGPILERIIVNATLAKTLASIRDAILPRLISGKLRVPQTEFHRA